jgi:NAD(P)-dependent dehydrogenase (short-subunit alcohol dehydrogenase family)
MRLMDRVCLVTGAGSGIGAAIALAFGVEGASVAATDIRLEAAERVAAVIRERGGAAIALEHDVAEEAAWEAVVKSVVARFGRIDVLVNNAGITTDSALVDLTHAAWRRVQAVNCDGVFLGMKHVIPVMPPGGSIVNMSSIYGKVGGRQHLAYCASKGAVTLMTKAAALECAEEKRGIRVNSVHPGYVRTPLFERLDEVKQARYTALHPLGRLGQAGEIAEAVLFLASAESSFMTGSELVVDGGFTAQ